MRSSRYINHSKFGLLQQLNLMCAARSPAGFGSATYTVDVRATVLSQFHIRFVLKGYAAVAGRGRIIQRVEVHRVPRFDIHTYMYSVEHPQLQQLLLTSIAERIPPSSNTMEKLCQVLLVLLKYFKEICSLPIRLRILSSFTALSVELY